MRRSRGSLGWIAAFLACLVAAGAASIRRGKDANWDLRNYHFYDVHALLAGRLGSDIAPAQAQTYHSPFADLPFHFLVQALDDPRHVAFWMAAPAAVAAFFLLRSLVILFPDGAPHRALSIMVAGALGVTGAAGVSVIGSTMNEWHCAALLMPALYLALRSAAQEERGGRGLLLAGLLAGVAVGLKLTYGIFALGLVAALASFGPWGGRVRRVALACAGLSLGFLAAYGPWAYVLQSEFASPFFPYFNDFFKSPYWEPRAWLDRRFGPRTALEALTFPVWFSHLSALVAEGSFRDYRLAAVFVLALAAVLRAPWGRRPRRVHLVPDVGLAHAWRAVAVFTLVSYAAWVPLFSIYRYLVPLELVSGALIVGCLVYLVPAGLMRRAAIIVLAILIVGTTRPMGWERVAFGSRYFDVSAPAMEREALVIVGHLHPMAYAIAFLAADARFVSPVNNLLELGQQNVLARRAGNALRRHEGPLYLLEYRRDPRLNDPTLAHFGLVREAGGCVVVKSDLDRDAMHLCRLHRPSG